MSNTLHRRDHNFPRVYSKPVRSRFAKMQFFALSEDVLGRERAQKAAQIILSIERIANLQDLLSAVAVPSKAG